MTDEKNNSEQNDNYQKDDYTLENYQNDNRNYYKYLAKLCCFVTPSMFAGAGLASYLFDGSPIAVYGGCLLGAAITYVPITYCYWNETVNKKQSVSLLNKFTLFHKGVDTKEVEENMPLLANKV